MNDVPKAQAMSGAEVEALLDSTGGLLKLENMEHADDIMLEVAGICDRDRVTACGVVHTRQFQKNPEYECPNYRSHIHSRRKSQPTPLH